MNTLFLSLSFPDFLAFSLFRLDTVSLEGDGGGFLAPFLLITAASCRILSISYECNVLAESVSVLEVESVVSEYNLSNDFNDFALEWFNISFG